MSNTSQVPPSCPPPSSRAGQEKVDAKSFPPGRTAVLVIHGMGAQKPYTTLDQFGRGVLKLLGGDCAVQKQVLFRPTANALPGHSGSPQAFVRLTPRNPNTSEDVIDIFEYYWAPVITGLVSSQQSLRFLLFSALTPFQYLRDNVTLIQQVDDKDVPHGSSFTLLKDHEINTAMSILLRELARMLFIFAPLMALFALLYWVVAEPIGNFVFKHLGQHTWQSIFFTKWPLTSTDVLSIFASGVRYLFIIAAILFLFDDLYPRHQGLSDKRITKTKSSRRSSLIMTLVLALLIIIPGIRFAPHIGLVIAIASILALLYAAIFSNVLHDAFRRGLTAISGHPITLGVGAIVLLSALVGYVWFRQGVQCVAEFIQKWFFAPPECIAIAEVFKFLLLGALLYVINAFLTSAIGGLAVYLGADELSRNYAARSIILNQATEAVVELLGNFADLDPKGSEPKSYDRLIIAAHSLGTVISFDVLNRLLVRREARDPALAGVDLTRITGLLTFGSPLNKVIYFFRTRTSLSTTLLERILFVLHPYRLLVPLSPAANGPIAVPSPFPSQDPFGTTARPFRWLNAYSVFDLISGRMFFYQSDCDCRIERGIMPWTAHLSYWENPALYTYFGQLL